jgi:DNA-binding response OmpR family regulator
MPLSVLIVDDDARLFELLESYLAQNAVMARSAPDGYAALRLLEEHAVDAVLLDIMMPGMDGLSVLRKVREKSDVPVIMLTAKGDETDRVVGLELGADDYLGKPVEPRLLLARIRRLLRRTETTPQPAVQARLQLDPRTRRATLGTRVLELTDAEFDLLLYLSARAGVQLSRAELARDVCGQQYDPLDRTIDVRIARLRAKLGDDPKAPRWIKSIRGVGYLFIQPHQE